jgi:hypothetical protein
MCNSMAAADTYPTDVFWGDTHVHTSFSWDAYTSGARLSPELAYRFAKGEAITADSGEEARLQRPLDFLVVADHAGDMGFLPRVAAGDARLLETERGRRLAQVLRDNPFPVATFLNAETDDALLSVYNTKYRGISVGASRSSATSPKTVKAAAEKPATSSAKRVAYSRLIRNAMGKIDDPVLRRSVWEEVGATAERHNDPGTFTAFIGYEWTAGPGSLHRNVIFKDGAERTNRVVPFSAQDSTDPQDLWAYMQAYEDQVGGKVLAIPHNGNLSRGAMFALMTREGQPFTKGYAEARSRWEPLYEVTQIKGDGETHPVLSPTDEFADYETWNGFTSPDSVADKQAEYARSALKLGLGQTVEVGANPFKFGMIGSSDAHTSLAAIAEDNFWGKVPLNEPSRHRVKNQWYMTASGYAAVWAEKNTREALFNAMRRREVYASTGPRMTVRFFGGWEYAAEDARRSDLARVGYAGGVPMGGDLTQAPEHKAPRFLIKAVKDPEGANLDRVQVIKGWRDRNGSLREKVFDVALSDARKVDAQGRAVAVGNTIDVANASYTNSIGDPELAVVWMDPDFDAGEFAFYYIRVLEIPTPRWTAYDAKLYGLTDLPDEVPMVTQERAYTSPIWYTP